MIILSNCLTPTVDEGCLKVANSLIKRIKKLHPETLVISYETTSELSDVHLEIHNKFQFSLPLARILLRRKEHLLYFPQVAKMNAMSVRVFLLSLCARRGMSVVLAQQHDMGAAARMILKLSRARIVTLSRDAWQYYHDRLGDQAVYIKTGVDTKRFAPAATERKAELRQKYGIPADKPVVLHVGHLNGRRNLSHLLALDDRFHIILVTSSWAAKHQDETLRTALLSKNNVTLLDGYLPDIQEIYQLSDVYFFPVVNTHGCINVPLSVMEAASCGIPVAATRFGELKELEGCPGFYWVDSFEPEALNALLRQAIAANTDPRDAVLAYDWDHALQYLLKS